jgi:Uma2 family endonuclease
MVTRTRATIEDLYRVEGKAEIVNGKIVYLGPDGAMAGYAADEVFIAPREFSRQFGVGRATVGRVAYHVDLPNRESFSPDAAFYIGPDPGMRFYEGAPVFAVEVRSESDYGTQAEREMAAKRADYFAARTQVVWDLDLLSSDAVRKYTIDRPTEPRVFHRGDIADAEPAVPGWSMPVDDLFE